MRYLKQSTSVDVPIGPFLDATDGVTAETGLTLTQPDIRLKKNGAAWAQKAAAQTLSHEENGFYEVTLDTTDTDTLGQLRLAVFESGAAPVWEDFMVMPANVYDSLFSTDLLQVDAREWLGGTIATPTTTGVPEVDLTHIAGTAHASTVIRANVVQISGDATAADNAELAFDGTGYNVGAGSIVAASVTGAVGSVTGAVGSVTGNVGGTINGLTATALADFFDTDSGTAYASAVAGSVVKEMADNAGGSALTEAGIADAVWDEARSGHVATGSFGQSLQLVRNGTAQAGAAGTITLDASASATDDFYNGCIIFLLANTGALQSRLITDYNGTTKVATIEPNWITNPDNTTTWVIYPAPPSTTSTVPAVDVVKWAGTAVATPSVAGVPEVDATHWLGTAVATPTTGGVPEVDVTAWLGTTVATPTTGGVPEVDVTHWIGTAAATPTTAGVPEVDVTHWRGGAVPAVSVSGVPEVDLTHVAGATTSVSVLATNVAAILVDTGTTLQAELDGIQADTEDIQARIPAALTAGGHMMSDVLAVSGDTTAADRLEALMDGLIIGQVNDAGATTTTFVADGFTEATNDHLNGRLITFISGALTGQQTSISDYVGATQTFTVVALTEAPADDVFFIVH